MDELIVINPEDVLTNIQGKIVGVSNPQPAPSPTEKPYLSSLSNGPIIGKEE